MDTLNGRFLPSSARSPAGPKLPGAALARRCWQAWRRLAAWRLVVAAETPIVLASIAFSVFYNHAFWHLLFS